MDTAAPLARWRLSAGDDFGVLERFLAPVGSEPSPVFPCPECGRDMVVVPCGGGFVGEAGEGAPCNVANGLTVADVAEHGIAWTAVLGWLGAMVGCAMERDGIRYGHVVAGGEVVQGFRRVPARICFSDDEATIGDEVARWMALAARPGIFLTARHHARCGVLLAKSGCGYFALEDLIGVDDRGCGVLVRSVEALVREIEQTGMLGGGAVPVLRRIEHDIESVAAQKRELVQENTDLKAMQAQGMFKFVSKVEAGDLRLFLAILAHGDQSKAARALGMRDSTFREQTKGWRAKGAPYRVMHSLIEWRKAVGGKKVVKYDDAVLQQDAPGSGIGANLLEQVLEGLREMTTTNWNAVRKELEDAIVAEYPR
ncbi:MAG: hypothetical protein PHR35_11510 [Kiritimatiellae bacterium]|nr:hypothetical protein [Kiritimatiellia bacterium]